MAPLRQGPGLTFVSPPPSSGECATARRAQNWRTIRRADRNDPFNYIDVNDTKVLNYTYRINTIVLTKRTMVIFLRISQAGFFSRKSTLPLVVHLSF